MTPGARLAIVCDLLDLVLTHERLPMDKICADFLRHKKFIGAKDRKDITQTLYRIMRHFCRFTYITENLQFDKNARALLFCDGVLNLGFDEKRFEEITTQGQYALSPLAPHEKAFIVKLLKFGSDWQDDLPENIRYECPSHYYDDLKFRR